MDFENFFILLKPQIDFFISGLYIVIYNIIRIFSIENFEVFFFMKRINLNFVSLSDDANNKSKFELNKNWIQIVGGKFNKIDNKITDKI